MVAVLGLHSVSEVGCGLCFMYLRRKDAHIGDVMTYLDLFIRCQLVVKEMRDCVTARLQGGSLFQTPLSLTCASQSHFHKNVCYDPNGTEQDALSLSKLHFFFRPK
jgi:hypothetical protein